MKLLMDERPDRANFPDPAKLLFISDNQEDKEAANQ